MTDSTPPLTKRQGSTTIVEVPHPSAFPRWLPNLGRSQEWTCEDQPRSSPKPPRRSFISLFLPSLKRSKEGSESEESGREKNSRRHSIQSMPNDGRLSSPESSLATPVVRRATSFNTGLGRSEAPGNFTRRSDQELNTPPCHSLLEPPLISPHSGGATAEISETSSRPIPPSSDPPKPPYNTNSKEPSVIPVPTNYITMSRWLPNLRRSQQWSSDDQPHPAPKTVLPPPPQRGYTKLFRKPSFILGLRRKTGSSESTTTSEEVDALSARRHSIQVDRLQIPESSESIFRRVASFDTRIARHEDPPPSSSEPDDTSSRPSSPPSPSTSDTGIHGHPSLDFREIEPLSTILDSPPPSPSIFSPPGDVARRSIVTFALPKPSLSPSQYQQEDAPAPGYQKLISRPSSSGPTQEGHEGLPSYSCDVLLADWMARKLEFTDRGVEARDRSWKLEYVIIRGTSLKIFKHDLYTHPVPGEDDGLDHTNSHLSDLRKLRGKRERHSPENELIRAYTLQFAEAGLATDYHSRVNVVRVRAENEQFLLQVKDAQGVLNLLETLQAAINVAVDVDQRVLPKVQTLPRSRRRMLAESSGNPVLFITEDQSVSFG